ncbi:Uncharacterized protein PCOAH_00048210 [Plasmodium coatneyi]|uniref:Tryptophan/threonine-rich plasmodium antigen C-terminal domain-containing protein n=1 Tax=Plasmodium coatneyi TaxID=208452 RepID=A0A1B1E6W9_9APIC|nr:Uncharacterized protein PCOAH_00048210 [Plasmodium coatneyi]ANQ10509.1 Uncharacterized protein PCOAH_00048210 [Plasmodium coatneyi]
MAHTTGITSSASSAVVQSQSGKNEMAVRSSENGVGAKKSTPGSFFTKRTAMLFFVAAYIFLKHQDDFARQNAAATLQVRNRIARNLKANTEAAPSDEELEYYEDGDESHGDSEESYEDPEEGYEDPEEGYENPVLAYEDPEEGYENPELVYEDPEEAYESHPQEIYKHHPEEMYEEYEEEGYSDDEREEEEYEGRPAEKEVYEGETDEEMDGERYLGEEEEEDEVEHDGGEEEDEDRDDDGDYQKPVQQNMPIRIPKDALVDESMPILDVQCKSLSKVSEKEDTAAYPLKREDLIREISKFSDWNTFMESVKYEWDQLKVDLQQSRKEWMHKKDNEWSEWMRLIENKWSVYGKVAPDEELDGSVVEPDLGDGIWSDYFKIVVKGQIDSNFEKWLNDTQSNLFNILLKGVGEFKDRKTKGWLVCQWNDKEGGFDYNKYGRMSTQKFLNLAQSREWYHENPNIEEQRKELMLWFFHKENEYLGYEWQNWADWKNEKLHSVKLLCSKLSWGRLDEEEWDKFLSEIKL